VGISRFHHLGAPRRLGEDARVMDEAREAAGFRAVRDTDDPFRQAGEALGLDTRLDRAWRQPRNLLAGPTEGVAEWIQARREALGLEHRPRRTTHPGLPPERIMRRLRRRAERVMPSPA
jgi:hypothetical protein